MTQVHKAIEETGRHGAYVFDCLSELASLWSADQMLGNFFLLTCPRLHELGSVSYFGLYRNHHASFAMHPVTETRGVPAGRVSAPGPALRPSDQGPAPFARFPDCTIHRWNGDEFQPMTDSAELADLMAFSGWPGLRRHAGRVLAADLP